MISEAAFDLDHSWKFWGRLRRRRIWSKFEIAVNAKTAKALGLVAPRSILLSANEVVE